MSKPLLSPPALLRAEKCSICSASVWNKKNIIGKKFVGVRKQGMLLCFICQKKTPQQQSFLTSLTTTTMILEQSAQVIDLAEGGSRALRELLAME